MPSFSFSQGTFHKQIPQIQHRHLTPAATPSFQERPRMHRFIAWHHFATAVQRFFSPVPSTATGTDGPGIVTPIAYG